MLTGVVPDARYWSYTLYGADDYLIPNQDQRYGYNAATMDYVPRDTLNPEASDQWIDQYQIKISADQQEGNWLPAGNNKALSITLRLYNASPTVYENLATIALPEIIKVN